MCRVAAGWERAVALSCPPPNADGTFTFTVRLNTASTVWAVGWGFANADGVVEQNYLSHSHMRLTSNGRLAQSEPPEPVFGGATQSVYLHNAVPGLLFECTQYFVFKKKMKSYTCCFLMFFVLKKVVRYL